MQLSNDDAVYDACVFFYLCTGRLCLIAYECRGNTDENVDPLLIFFKHLAAEEQVGLGTHSCLCSEEERD